jgi:hypothetical protein
MPEDREGSLQVAGGFHLQKRLSESAAVEKILPENTNDALKYMDPSWRSKPGKPDAG